MKPNSIIQGDCLEQLKLLPDEIIQTCVTSPPYWGLRDYGTASWQGGDENCDHKTGFIANASTLEGGKSTIENAGSFYKSVCAKCGAIRIDDQLGLEETPELYVEKMVQVFREVKRILKPDGTLWLNLGDSYMSGGGASRHHGYTDPKYTNGRKVEHFEPQAFPHKTIKPKDLVGIPWRVAFALQADGWYLRQDIIWHKPNPMPESVQDRCTKSHEYVFLLAKNGGKTIIWHNKKTKEWVREKPNLFGVLNEDYYIDGEEEKTYWRGHDYYYDNEAIMEKSIDKESYTGRRPRNQPEMDKVDPENFKYHGSIKNGKLRHGQTYEMRNKRSVWTVNTKPYKGAHFAVFPEELIKPCILAGSAEKDVVFDPFTGSGTTLALARKLGRQYLGIELNPEYINLAEKRIKSEYNMFENL